MKNDIRKQKRNETNTSSVIENTSHKEKVKEKTEKGKLLASKKKIMKWDEQEQEEMNPLPASERECNEINKNI